jgi:hypothetical protein
MGKYVTTIDAIQWLIIYHPDWHSDRIHSELIELGFDPPTRFMIGNMIARSKRTLRILEEVGMLEEDAKPNFPLPSV